MYNRMTTRRWVRALAMAGPCLLPAAGAQAQTSPPAKFECAAGELAGIKPSDGETAVGMVCRELALASGEVGRYRVSLRPLGYSVVLEVERLDLPARDTATLAGVEEVATAAARLAQAVARNEPLRASQRVDTLLWDETRRRPLKDGKLSWGLGVLGLQAAGRGVRSGGGFSASLTYNATSFEVPVQFRVAHTSGTGDGADLVGFDAGMRWLPSRKSISPFLGGGMGWLSFSVDERNPREYWDHGTYGGMAPYLEAGVEMLRLHRARVLISVRTDIPLSSLERSEGCSWNPSSQHCEPYPARSFYAAPVTLGFSVAF